MHIQNQHFWGSIESSRPQLLAQSPFKNHLGTYRPTRNPNLTLSGFAIIGLPDLLPLHGVKLPTWLTCITALDVMEQVINPDVLSIQQNYLPPQSCVTVGPMPIVTGHQLSALDTLRFAEMLKHQRSCQVWTAFCMNKSWHSLAMSFSQKFGAMPLCLLLERHDDASLQVEFINLFVQLPFITDSCLSYQNTLSYDAAHALHFGGNWPLSSDITYVSSDHWYLLDTTVQDAREQVNRCLRTLDASPWYPQECHMKQSSDDAETTKMLVTKLASECYLNSNHETYYSNQCYMQLGIRIYHSHSWSHIVALTCYSYIKREHSGEHRSTFNSFGL